MDDSAFDDFLDSDDDEFFLQASNHILDYDLMQESKSTQAKETNSSSAQSKVVTSSCFEEQASTLTKNQINVSCSNEISSDKYENFIRNESATVGSLENNNSYFKISSNCKEEKDEVAIVTNSVDSSSCKISDYSRNVSKCKDTDKNITVTTMSSECNTSVFQHLNKTTTPTTSLYINNRFTPGFTPKTKKRKLPGPAGLLELFDDLEETVSGNSHKMLTMDMEYENIVSSQYTPEHLSLSSWQKLQTAVSSCSNLRSTAKYYSIQRVLQESSKKKLPKHMVVPVLCVLLKKLNNKGSTTISVFMDDTGEINGKIDAEVVSMYKEMLVEGTALILKKVTFLCNVLILKSQNLVSMYHPDGSEKHPQILGSILDSSEPLKPMNCECLKLSYSRNTAHKDSHYSPNNHTSSCISHSQNRLNNVSNQNKTTLKSSRNINMPNSYKSAYNSQIQNKINVSNQKETVNKSVSSPKQSFSVNEATDCNKSIRSDTFLETLLDEDNCVDDFDELLGNLDEKSFLEDV